MANKKLYLVKHPRQGKQKPTFITSNQVIAYVAAYLWLGDFDSGFPIQGSYKELDINKDEITPIMMQNIVCDEADTNLFVTEEEFEEISAALYAQDCFGLEEEVWRGMSQDEQSQAIKWAKKSREVIRLKINQSN